MDSRDDVFALVKSLTASEKRFFTLHARRHVSDPKYLRMFEVLDSMSVYDEDALRRAFVDASSCKHLAVIRHTLVDEIISSLANWSAHLSPDEAVQREVDAARFLFDKGSRVFAERHVRKALSIAIEHELPVRVLEACTWQRRLHPESPKHLQAILEQELNAVTMVHELHLAQSALEALNDHVHTHNEIHSNVARVRLLRAALRTSVRTGDRSETHHCLQRIVLAIRSLSQYHQAHSREWCDTLLEVLVEASLQQDRETLRDVEDVLDVMSSISHPHAVRRLLDSVTTFARCALALHEGTPENVLEQHVDSAGLPPGMAAVWGVHRAALHLAADRSQMALQLINEVLNSNSLRCEHPRWYGQALILNVMIHYAIGNEEYVPYCIRSAQRKGEAKQFFSVGDLALLRMIGRVVDRTDHHTVAEVAAVAISTSPLISVIRAWAASLDRRIKLDLNRSRVGAA